MAIAMVVEIARVKAVGMGMPRVRTRTTVITVAMAMTTEMAIKMTTSIRTQNAERWEFMGGGFHQ